MKNKKTYYPFGLDSIMYLAFSLISIGVLIFILVRYNDILRVVIVSILSTFALYFFLKIFLIYRIIFDDKIVKIGKDYGLFQEDRVQSKVEVDLTDMKEFKVILSESNSNGEKMNGHSKKKKYLEFIMNDDSRKRILVSYMNKKQLLSIIKRIEDYTNKEVTIK